MTIKMYVYIIYVLCSKFQPRPPSFSEKSLFAQGVHASVRLEQKDQITNGWGNSFPPTITKSAPQGKISLGEKAQRSGFFPSVA